MRTAIIGDAVRTGHFSIGCGTRLAMEDSIALAAAFEKHGENVADGLAEYESARRSGVRSRCSRPKSARQWGWPNHPGLIGGFGQRAPTLSMQDASMRGQMGLDEQSAPHFAQAMSSVMPLLVERYREPMRFLGRKIAPGARSAVQSERLDPDG